ncbi:MAG: LptF/LptG family permease [Endomicrobiales bacterium]|nr:LptF/LptG family permease [Endomicrobiales bacterium]
MKILHKYTLHEFTEAFLFGLLITTSILIIDQLFQLINLFLGKGVSAFTVIKLFALALPNILSMTIPMAVLIGTLLAFGRFSEDNEITAIRSAGFNVFEITKSVLLAVIILCFVLVYYNHFVSPATHREFRQLYVQLLTKRPLVKFEERSINSLGDYKIYVESVDRVSNTLKKVNIYKFSQSELGAPLRISASLANVNASENEIIFSLIKGYLQKPDPEKLDTLSLIKFDTYKFKIPITKDAVPASVSLREMPSPILLSEIKSYKKLKLPVAVFETEYWLRYVLAFAPFCFLIVGIPLAISVEKGGKIGFGLSLVVIFLYYILLVLSINAGEKNILPSALVLWLPNVVVLSSGVFLWRKMLRR